MKICGIIAEYDPFHNGHAWHLKEARRITNADCIVCVISGSFTQRGMPALLPAHARSAMALDAGADIVLQLPVSFSVCNAERFALGGVSVLSRLGASSLCFGAETEGIPCIEKAAGLLENPTDTLQDAIKKRLQSGVGFPRAQGEALAEALGTRNDVLALPNTSLAIAYARANIRLNAGLTLHPVCRSGNYHDAAIPDDGSLPSATAVRAAMLSGDWMRVKQSVPSFSYEMLTRLWKEGDCHAPGALDDMLRFQLRVRTDFSRIPDLSEGIENRFAKAADCLTREEMIASIKSKRYPYARISRMLTHILLDTDKTQISPLPQYAYILGFRKEASALLRLPSDGGFRLFSAADPQDRSYDMSLDARADDLWALGAKRPFGALYRSKPFVL